MLDMLSGTGAEDPPVTGRQSCPEPVLRSEACSPITLLPSRTTERPMPTVYSTRLLDSVSPFQVASTCIPAQAPGILVIDDEPEIRRMVSEILSSEGYLVLPAANGAEALAVMDGARVSLALLDMRMPVLDGWGFARQLRERHSRVPLIVLSAAEDAPYWAEEIGAAACIRKPFDLVDLLDTVEYLVAPR
jgi:two-component system chemotaxis response regulator CheY